VDWMRKELNNLRRASGATASFKLVTGETYRYNPRDTFFELFYHSGQSARADYQRRPRPPLPEHYHNMAQAQDRLAAVKQLWPDVRLPVTVERPGPFTAVNLNVLVDEGSLEHRWMAPSCEPIIQ